MSIHIITDLHSIVDFLLLDLIIAGHRRRFDLLQISFCSRIEWCSIPSSLAMFETLLLSFFEPNRDASFLSSVFVVRVMTFWPTLSEIRRKSSFDAYYRGYMAYILCCICARYWYCVEKRLLRSCQVDFKCVHQNTAYPLRYYLRCRCVWPGVHIKVDLGGPTWRNRFKEVCVISEWSEV